MSQDSNVYISIYKSSTIKTITLTTIVECTTLSMNRFFYQLSQHSSASLCLSLMMPLHLMLSINKIKKQEKGKTIL